MEENEYIDLRDVLKIIVNHRRLIAAVFSGAVLASLMLSFLATPIYQTSTTIMVKEQSSLENPLLDIMQDGKPETGDYVDLLKSRSIFFAAANKLKLVKDENSPEMEKLQKSVKIQTSPQSSLIQVQVESPDPVLARDLANQMVQELMARNREDNSQEARNAREFIAKQMDEISGQLTRAEEALQNYKETNKVFAPTEEATAAIDRIAKLEQMRYETEVAWQETEARIQKLSQGLNQGGEPESLVENPAIQVLKGKLAEVEAELAGAREKYTDKHPLVLSLMAQAGEIKRQMISETGAGMSDALAVLQVESWVLQERQKALSRLSDSAEADFARLPEEERQLTVLMRDAKVLEQIYLMLRQKFEEAKITEAVKSSDIKVVDAAITPLKPVRPRKTLNVVIAAFLGLFVGVGAAFVAEYLNTTLRNAKEAEQLLGLPVLGKIPSYGPGSLPQNTKK